MGGDVPIWGVGGVLPGSTGVLTVACPWVCKYLRVGLFRPRSHDCRVGWVGAEPLVFWDRCIADKTLLLPESGNGPFARDAL